MKANFYPWNSSSVPDRRFEHLAKALTQGGPTLLRGVASHDEAAGTTGGDAEVLAGAPPDIDFGAQVGILRNLEFSAGARAHRISTGAYTRS